MDTQEQVERRRRRKIAKERIVEQFRTPLEMADLIVDCGEIGYAVVIEDDNSYGHIVRWFDEVHKMNGRID